jgi:hypothetical protein
VLLSSFGFLDGNGPADPLIARERRDVLPFGVRRGIGEESFSQVGGEAVHWASGNGFFGHGVLYIAGQSVEAPDHLQEDSLLGEFVAPTLWRFLPATL